MRGDNGQLGFVAMSRLLDELAKIGFIRSDVSEATYFCLSKNLIEVETSSADKIRPADSVKATASGWAHMRILSSRIEYISSVLMTTPISNKILSSQIFEAMQIEHRVGQISFYQSTRLVESFLSYLKDQRQTYTLRIRVYHRKTGGGAIVCAKRKFKAECAG